MSRTKPKILLADTEEYAGILERALRDEFEVSIVTTFSEATARLDSSYDLIICGMHFDDSNMFDLLSYAIENQSTTTVPFLSIKAAPGVLSPILIKSVQMAVTKLGAIGFIDWSSWVYTDGLELASQRLRYDVSEIISRP